MNRKLMMQYLEKVSQMECQVYTLNRAYWDLHNQSERLGHSKTIQKPKKPEKEKLNAKDIGHSIMATVVFFIPVWFALFVVITVVVASIGVAVYGDAHNTPEYIQELGGGLMIYLPTILAPIGIFAVTLYQTADEIKSEKKRYQKELSVYQAAVAADTLRVQQELEVKSVLCAQRDAVSAQYRAAKNALDALYNLDIIEQEYRDLAAVTTFYSYFRKEYCTSLAGPNQAYDRYDHALEIGEIINKLDVIISKLDEIVKNQAYLAKLLQDSNDTLRRIEGGNKRMLDSMQRTEENTELIEYNTKCAARSSEVTELLTLYNTLKQDKDD